MDETKIIKAEAFFCKMRTLKIHEQQAWRREIDNNFLVMLNVDEDRFGAALSGILMTPRMLYYIAHRERYIGIGVEHG